MKRISVKEILNPMYFINLIFRIIMKVIQLCLYLFAIGSFNSLFAQEETANGMLFPQFEKGIVAFKSGVQSSASLNYSMIQEQMMFLDADSTVLALANPLEVLVVIIGERRFFPVSSSGVFYEEIPTGKSSFFVNRSATMISQGKAAAYGGYSQISSSTSLSSWRSNGGGTVKLNVDEKFRLEIKCTYYLKIGNSYKSFYSAKTLGKLFKGHEPEIEKFANEQSINFSKMDDIARIVEYGYSLTTNK